MVTAAATTQASQGKPADDEVQRAASELMRIYYPAPQLGMQSAQA